MLLAVLFLFTHRVSRPRAVVMLIQDFPANIFATFELPWALSGARHGLLGRNGEGGIPLVPLHGAEQAALALHFLLAFSEGGFLRDVARHADSLAFLGAAGPAVADELLAWEQRRAILVLAAPPRALVAAAELVQPANDLDVVAKLAVLRLPLAKAEEARRPLVARRLQVVARLPVLHRFHALLDLARPEAQKPKRAPRPVQSAALPQPQPERPQQYAVPVHLRRTLRVLFRRNPRPDVPRAHIQHHRPDHCAISQREVGRIGREFFAWGASRMGKLVRLPGTRR